MDVADVVIVGAGPNGLMLACELALAGVRPIVIERLAVPDPSPRANGLVGQVVRALDRRGLYERLSDTMVPQPVPAFVFGALRLDLGVLEDNPLYILPVPQLRVTQVLAERAVELGVQIRRGHELVGIAQDDDVVTIDVVGPNGADRLQARYLVGADGGHSVTRKLSGIDFPGVTADETISRTVHATVPPGWLNPATGMLEVPGYGAVPSFAHHRTERGLFVFAPFPDRPPLISSTEWDGEQSDDAPMTLEEMRASVERVLGVDVPLEAPAGEGPHMLRRLVGRSTRLAERFRDRRVFLVGDAAHVHSAIGGPGLNLGLQDAVNLGWKLAAAVQGRAPSGLLDSYEAERRPVAQRVVMHTQAQSALIAPGSAVTALRELFAELLEHPDTVQHIADLMSGADIRYPMPGATHPLAGRWAPDMVVHTGAGTSRLAELTRNGRPLLLDLTADGSAAAALRGSASRIDVVTADGSTPAPATVLLLRPDGYVAWASAATRPDAIELEALQTAAQHWFGAVRASDAVVA